MLTRNYYNALRAAVAKTLIAKGIKNVNGSAYDAGYSGSEITPGPILSSVRFDSSSGIIIGKGTTAPTLDDYYLESQITSGLTASNSRGIDENGNPYTVITLANATTKSITVGEVGIIASVYYGTGGYTCYALLDRTVLDSPITIEPGGVGQITYTIRMNYPT